MFAYVFPLTEPVSGVSVDENGFACIGMHVSHRGLSEV
jgi:hypothetical protein